MSLPVTVAVVIATPHGLQHIVGAEERDVAGPAEDCLRGLRAGADSATFWIQTHDAAMRARLMDYLGQVKREVVAETALGMG